MCLIEGKGMVIKMKKITPARSVIFVSAILIFLFLLSACGGGEESRLPAIYTYNPGAVFTTNIRDDDPRKMVKCAVVFEVIDEAASIDLVAYNSVIRNAVLVVLGDLTSEELTKHKDLEEISQRLVDKVNEALAGRYSIVTGAYFTEFALS